MTRKFDDFDDFGRNYREVHNRSIKISGADSNYYCEYKIVEIKKSEEQSSLRILDIGCGDGTSATYFKRYFPNCQYYGIDISAVSINTANMTGLDNCFFEKYDGEKIPFDTETFDIILIACVMHHINENFHLNILAEIKRVLKTTGRLYLFEHNPYNPITRKLVNDCEFDKDAVLIASSKLEILISKTGFKEIQTKFTLFFPRHAFFRMFLFLEKYLSKIPLGGQYYLRAIK